MPPLICWANQEQTVILQEYDGPWTWEEFDAAIDHVAAMACSVEHTLALIVDDSRGAAPRESGGLGHFRRAWDTMPHNVGAIIVVGGKPFLSQLGNIVSKVLGGGKLQMRMVSTLDEALAFAAERTGSPQH